MPAIARHLEPRERVLEPMRYRRAIQRTAEAVGKDQAVGIVPTIAGDEGFDLLGPPAGDELRRDPVRKAQRPLGRSRFGVIKRMVDAPKRSPDHKAPKL